MQMSEASDAKPMKKKEKQMLKHELFLQRLEDSRSPYSKSHERRMKRKAKEQVAGGLSEIHAAITALDDGSADHLPVARESGGPNTEGAAQTQQAPKHKSGQIGEGKGATLSKAQRKRALQTERLRMPLIRSNPAFSTNPFQTIRTHAQNTLVKHQVPEPSLP
ncbi:ribosome biogenesis protein SLX9-domain-containing protein [Cristinia sonorae]|uniref:Ribosome biogenesis protein SLX9 n=1 Tax=Cristinia sonorae TaxID=1940300 RepID=A0A8K0URW0_9AGAR|nr:ribosome biogenesis protein SLX9-domain-containing protein [Cristinia sonorae]